MYPSRDPSLLLSLTILHPQPNLNARIVRINPNQRKRMIVKFPVKDYPCKMSEDELLDTVKNINSQIRWNFTPIASVSNEENSDLLILLRINEDCYQDLEKERFKLQFVSGYVTFFMI